MTSFFFQEKQGHGSQWIMLNPLSNLVVNVDSAKQVVSKDSSIHQFRLMSTFCSPQSWVTLHLVMHLTSILGHHTPKHELIGLFFFFRC